MQTNINLVNSSKSEVNNGEEVFLRSIPANIKLNELTPEALRLLVYYVSKQGPYELAIESGYFKGSLSQWLQSLKANFTLKATVRYYHELGHLTGLSEGDMVFVEETDLVYFYSGSTFPEKEKGMRLTGASAYQIALEQGFVGTPDEWLASLKGEPFRFEDFTSEQLDLITGPTGLSAYDLAVEQGFKGNLTQWLDYLVGPKGDKGDKGDAGINGKSAYQLAVDNGFLGTSDAWLATLKGDKGDKGISAYDVALLDGYVGSRTQWLEDLIGDSAYEIATQHGYTGTIEEWVVSLTGKSAYELAVQNGFQGSENAWLNSLKGKSAYELAVLGGYSGTQNQWLDSLRGKDAYQVAVQEGYSGTREQWLEFIKGRSAYQLAVQNGYQGTEDQWLNSLRGKSAYGVAVDNGYQGSQEEWLASLKGASAYTLAVAQGYEGTLFQWLQSLRGEQGHTGKSVYELAVELGYTGTVSDWYKNEVDLKSFARSAELSANTAKTAEETSTEILNQVTQLSNSVSAIVDNKIIFQDEATLLLEEPLESTVAKALDTKKLWYWDIEKLEWIDLGVTDLDLAKVYVQEYVSEKAEVLFASQVELAFNNNMVVRRYTVDGVFNEYPEGTYQTQTGDAVQLSVTASGSSAIKHYFNTKISTDVFEANFVVTKTNIQGDSVGIGFLVGEQYNAYTYSNSGNLAKIANQTSSSIRTGLGNYVEGDTVTFKYSNNRLTIYINGSLKATQDVEIIGDILIAQGGFSHYLVTIKGKVIDPVREYINDVIVSSNPAAISPAYYSFSLSEKKFTAYTQVKGNVYIGCQVINEIDERDLIYVNYWRMVQADFYRFENNQMQPMGISAVVGGENEFVFKQNSTKDDFTGGYHGDEQVTSIIFMVDGQKISLTSDKPLTPANKVEYIEKSTMHETSENGEVIEGHPIVAYHTKHTEFKNGGYKTRNKVVWNYNGTLSTLYHGISCISKDVATIIFSDDDYTEALFTGTDGNFFESKGSRLYKGRNENNKTAVEATSYHLNDTSADITSDFFVKDRTTDSKYYRKSPAKVVAEGEVHESGFECYFFIT